MKKPPYFRIELASSKGTKAAAAIKYLKLGSRQPVNITFGKHRHRKVFRYRVSKVDLEEHGTWNGTLHGSRLVIDFELMSDTSD